MQISCICIWPSSHRLCVSHALSCYVSVSSTLSARTFWHAHSYWIRPTLMTWFTLIMSLKAIAKFSYWVLKLWLSLQSSKGHCLACLCPLWAYGCASWWSPTHEENSCSTCFSALDSEEAARPQMGAFAEAEVLLLSRKLGQATARGSF